jgi:hypothetical protein
MTTKQVPAEKSVQDLSAAREALKASANFDFMKVMTVIVLEYEVSKYVREDNTPENAKYLGYLDAKELYPDFKPVSFKSYLTELFAGQGIKPYQGRFQ